MNCPACGGTGKISMLWSELTLTRTCKRCNGTGENHD